MKIKLADITDGRLTNEQEDSLKKYFERGGTWQNLLEMDDSQVEGVYDAGYKYYEKGEYDKALTAFSGLIQLSPYEAKHWIAIGATLQAKGSFEDAIASYEVALSLDEKNIFAHYYCGQCAYQLHQNGEAIRYFQKLIEIADESGEELEIARKAAMILKVLHKEGL